MLRILSCLRLTPVVLCAVLLSSASTPEGLKAQPGTDAPTVSAAQLEALSG